MLRSIFAPSALCALSAVAATAGFAAPALASSEDAWAALRADVRTACEALADVPEGATASYAVNPFGSESYGAALVTVTLRDGSADRMVCVYDKQAKTAEMTAPFGEMPDRPTPAAMTGTAGESEADPGPLTQATATDAPAAPPQATLPAPDTSATPAPDAATDATPTGTADAAADCDLEAYRAHIGRPQAEIPIPDGANVRVITPDMMVTMDYVAGRVNLHVGTDGTLGDVTCG